jgi:RNA polymerase sigma-70 factor (ECF subfamily)
MGQRPLRIVRHEERVAGGQPASFDAFFADESQTLFRRMWLVTRDRYEAEEIVQDAFLSVYERWDRVSAMDDPTGYLYRTAFNAWKKRGRRAARAVGKLLSGGTPGDDFAAADARTDVGKALVHLAPRQRAALVLTELLGFSSEEAGEILGIRAVTARVLASQARAAMRQRLEERDE